MAEARSTFASLSQKIVSIVPGDRSRKTHGAFDIVGTNEAEFNIDNDSDQEREYEVVLASPSPEWSAEWFKLNAQPSPQTQREVMEFDKGRRLSVPISNKNKRGVVIDFFGIKQSPECLAGKYPFEIRCKPLGMSKGDDAKPIIEQGLAVIQPFFNWEATPAREEMFVGTFRRKRKFEIQVFNRGNDWLYVEVLIGANPTMTAESKIERLAVPPPRPGTKEEMRSIEVIGRTKLRTFRGAPREELVPVSLRRMHAPSVPQISDERPSPNAPVTIDDQPPESARQVPMKLVYCPPIPLKVTDFFQSIARNFKSILMWIAGLVAMYQLMGMLGLSSMRNLTGKGTGLNSTQVTESGIGKYITVSGEVPWYNFVLNHKLVLNEPGKADVVSFDMHPVNPSSETKESKEGPLPSANIKLGIDVTKDKANDKTAWELFNGKRVEARIESSFLANIIGAISPGSKKKSESPTLIDFGAVKLEKAEAIPIVCGDGQWDVAKGAYTCTPTPALNEDMMSQGDPAILVEGKKSSAVSCAVGKSAVPTLTFKTTILDGTGQEVQASFTGKDGKVRFLTLKMKPPTLDPNVLPPGAMPNPNAPLDGGAAPGGGGAAPDLHRLQQRQDPILPGFQPSHRSTAGGDAGGGGSSASLSGVGQAGESLAKVLQQEGKPDSETLDGIAKKVGALEALHACYDDKSTKPLKAYFKSAGVQGADKITTYAIAAIWFENNERPDLTKQILENVFKGDPNQVAELPAALQKYVRTRIQ